MTQNPSSPKLLTPAELASMDRHKVVIFDCSFSLADHSWGRKTYQQGHIPGAYHLDLETDLAGNKGAHGGRHPLPSATQFQNTLRNHGVDNDSLVVIYCANRHAGSARLWWMLNYFGHDKIAIVNGGLPAWKSEGQSLQQGSTALPAVQGNFTATPQQLPTVDRDWILDNINNPNIQLVDSRDEPRYRGDEEPMDAVAGHIPGALNLPWGSICDDAGYLLPTEQQRQRVAHLLSEKTCVVYCGSGVTANANILAMSLAGMDNTVLYPGSWSDWSSYPNCPVETV